ncbi:phage tail tape measure protein, TP901 family, core region [Bacillus cereus VD156]|uniref:phage tail tape measure protein n=1 Tax=Bacillus cereus TaxID=1396 RepID=UPI000279B5E3|nr:phage tail tape measure protein [Bacillus cereus]EJR82892.1 phage tail tape measure protein, TP901 family, core region [Bacillus cereus VD156]
MQQATQAVRNFHQAVSRPINVPTPNMSGWNSAVQSAGQHVQQLNSQMRNMTPPPPPNMSAWQSTFQNVGGRVQEVGHRVQQAGQTMQNAFAPAAAASGLALGKMIQDSREFESQTRKAAILTGGSYNQVKKDILDMAKTSVYSTGQVAAAYAEMGAKGFNAAQSTAALPGVLSAAAASGEDLGLVANTITSALNAFGLEASESGRVADILAQAANQSAAGMLDMNYAFKYAAGPAHTLGISMEELAASIGIMVDAGSTGESAGTALRASLLRLVSPPKAAAKALDKLGITTTDSNGKMKSLAQIMGELQKGMANYTDAQKASTMAAIFGTEAVSGMLNLMNAGPEKINEMTKALENSAGSSKKAADAMLEGWAGALTQMESALDAAARAFTDALAPAITFASDKIASLANWFSDLPSSVQTVIATTVAATTAFLIFGTVLGIMINSIGGGIIMFGTFIGWLGKSATVAKLASAAMVGLRAAFAFLTGPIGIAVMALTAVGVALSQLYQRNESFRNSINSVVGSIKGFCTTLSALGKYLFAVAEDGDYLNDWITHLPTGFQDAAQKIGEAVSKIRDGIIQLFDATKAAFSGDFSQIGEIFKMIGPSIAGAIIGGIPGVIISISRYLPAIAEHLNANKGIVVEAITNVFNSIAEFLTTSLPQLIEVGSQMIMSLVNGLVQAAPSILEAMVGVINTIMQSIATYLPMLIEAGMQIIQALISGIVQVLPTIIQTGLQLILTLIQGIMQMIPTLIPVAVTIIETIVNGLMSFLPQLIEIGINVLTSLITGITQAIPMIVLVIITVITTLIDAITANLPAIVEAGVSILTTLVDGIVKMLPQLIDLAVTLITKVADTILANLPAIINAGVKILMSLIDGIVKILPQLINAALTLIAKIVETLIANLPKIIDAGVKILMALIAGIFKIIPQLIVAAVKLVVTLVGELIKNLPKILEAGVKLVEALIKGLLSLLGQLGKAALDLGKKIINTIKEVNLFDIGANIIKGLINGLGSMFSSVWGKMKELGNGIKDQIAGILGIHSPSRVMRDYGVYIGQGLVIGMDSMVGTIEKAAGRMADAATPRFETIAPSELFQFTGDNPLTNYFNAIFEDGDALNDWITHIPESIRDAVRDIGQQMERFEGLTKAEVNSLARRRLQVGPADELTYRIVNEGVKPQRDNQYARASEIVNRQPAYINVQLGKQEFSRFVDDITGEQEAVRARREVF